MNAIRRSQERNEKINQTNGASKRGEISDSEPSFPLMVSTGDYETDAVVAYAIGDTTYEIQDSVMVGHFDANGKDTVRRIYLTKVDKGLEDIIAKFEWAGYTSNVKEGYIEFINPDIKQFEKLLDLIDENRYGNTAKETTNDAADVTFGTRRDRLAAYEAWLQSGKGDENREVRDFVRQAKERLEAESGGDGGNDGDSGNGGPHNGEPKGFSDAYQSLSTPDERAKSYKKAVETYRSNQQLLKAAAPNKKSQAYPLTGPRSGGQSSEMRGKGFPGFNYNVNENGTAVNADAEAILIESYLNSTVNSKYLGQLLRESGMDNKTIKEVTPPHRGLLVWKETFDRKGHAMLNVVAGEKHCVPVSTNDCLSAMC